MPLVIAIRLDRLIANQHDLDQAYFGNAYGYRTWHAIRRIMQRNGLRSKDVKRYAFIEL